jgi:hypothetical protein
MSSIISLIFLLELWRALRAGLSVSAVGILVLLGSAESLAQCTSQGGQSGSYTVTLNDVTLANRVVWTAQSIVAPERLSGFVPLHVYRVDQSVLAAGLSEATRLSGHERGIMPERDWHVGVAIVVRNQDRDVWRARPLLPGHVGVVFPMVGNAGEPESDRTEDAAQPAGVRNCYIVSSIPLAGQSEVEHLWVPEGDWQRGFPRRNAMNPLQQDAMNPP